MTQLGDAGGLRLEKKLAQVAAASSGSATSSWRRSAKRLGEVEADFRGRLAALARRGAERAALEERLTELARRIDQTVSRAEQRLDALQGLAR